VTSIFQRALGAEFERLHPQLRRRFGFSSADGVAVAGFGVMERVWRGPAFTLPFLYLGARRNMLFPEQGRDVAFVIENYAYLDRYGRETVTFVRTFELPGGRRRRFDATMVYDPARGRVVDYLGTHQHLAVDLELSVDRRGGLCIRSGEQRFREGRLDFRFPLALSGRADVYEWYDDERERFGIRVRVSNRWFGPLFGYRGTFTMHRFGLNGVGVPGSVKPLREEVRF
jgi:Domain of unknown function (DUF4166)